MANEETTQSTEETIPKEKKKFMGRRRSPAGKSQRPKKEKAPEPEVESAATTIDPWPVIQEYLDKYGPTLLEAMRLLREIKFGTSGTLPPEADNRLKEVERQLHKSEAIIEERNQELRRLNADLVELQRSIHTMKTANWVMLTLVVVTIGIVFSRLL